MSQSTDTPLPPEATFCWETPDRRCDRNCGSVCKRFAEESVRRLGAHAIPSPLTRTPWLRVLRDIVDVLVIGCLMVATTVFAVVAIMMLDGFEPPAWLVAFAALIGGAYACWSMGGMIIGRHIRWRT